MPSLPTVSIALTAAAFGGFGLWLLVDPAALGAVGVGVDGPMARTEIRAFYAGLELGIAGFLLLCLRKPAWHAPALWLQVLALGGAGLFRTGGMVWEAEVSGLMIGLATAELGAAVIGLAALRSLANRPG